MKAYKSLVTARASPPACLPASTAMTSFTDRIRAACLALVAAVAGAADHPGVGISKEHCGRFLRRRR